MKKKIYSILTLAVALFSLTGCEKELMDYEGKDCLYFDVRRGASWIEPDLWAHWNYSEVTFGNILSNDTTIAVKISATGAAKDFDRAFQVIVTKDSTDLQEGVEYEPLKPEYAIKAGETSTFVDVTFHRTERMNNDTLKFQLQIIPNDYFHTMFEKYLDYPGPYDASQPKVEFNYNPNARFHNMFVDDVLIQPEQWFGSDLGGGTFGKFSDVKFKFMMEEQMIILSVKNTCNQMIIYHNNEIATTKMINQDEHGVGIKNIIRIVEKYNGEYVIQNDEDQFYFSIIIPL